MSLLGFQQALSALCADPRLGCRLRAAQEIALPGFELTAQEHRRLAGMVAHRGMAANWTLYRANRLTPLFRLLPLTFAALGEGRRQLLDQFWAGSDASLQNADEAARFCRFILDQATAGDIEDPVILAVTRLEMMGCELRFLPRRRILNDLRAAQPKMAPGTRLVPHPLVRVVTFPHEPDLLLAALMQGASVPCDLPVGEYHLLLDWRPEEPVLLHVDARLGKLLLAAEDPAAALSASDAAALANAGLLVPDMTEWPRPFQG
jgi:hypothetical protein